MSARANFVNRARKNYPKHGIKRGESYWWWKFQRSPKQYSKTRPTRSQLTRSEFWSRIYALQDEATSGTPYIEDIEDRIGEIKTALEEVRDETQEKHDNMPQSLRDGATGELLQGRADACEEAISALDSVYVDIPETEDEEKKDEAADAIWNGVVDAVEGINCE
jgi:hypothetical protein